MSAKQLDDRLSRRNFMRLIRLNKLILDDSFGALASRYEASTTDMREVYLNWFSQNREEFMKFYEYYLGKEINSDYFILLLAAVIKSTLLSAKERSDIVNH